MTITVKSHRKKRSVLVILAATVALLLGGATAGYAYWQLQGQATITATAGKLAGPTVTCHEIEGGVQLEWTPNPPRHLKHYVVNLIIEHPRKSDIPNYESDGFVIEELSPEKRSYKFTGLLSDVKFLGPEKQKKYLDLERYTGVKSRVAFAVWADYSIYYNSNGKSQHAGHAHGGTDPSLNRVNCKQPDNFPGRTLS